MKPLLASFQLVWFSFFFHGKDCSRRSGWRGRITLCCRGGEHNKMCRILRTEMWVVQVKRWAWVIFDSVLHHTDQIWDFILWWSTGHLLAEHIKTVCCCLLAEWLQASNQNLTWQLGDLSSPVLFHISSPCWHMYKVKPTRGRKRPFVSERLLLDLFVKTQGCFKQPLCRKTTKTHKGRKVGEQRLEANSSSTIAASWPWVFFLFLQFDKYGSISVINYSKDCFLFFCFVF